MSEVELPEQIDVSDALAVTTGIGFTAIEIFVESIQPNISVPTTVYVVGDEGLPNTLDPVEELKLPVGLQT